jgi:hypothetical protein
MARGHGPSSTILTLAVALCALGLVLVLIAAGTGVVVLAAVFAALSLVSASAFLLPISAPRPFAVLPRTASPRAPPSS